MCSNRSAWDGGITSKERILCNGRRDASWPHSLLQHRIPCCIWAYRSVQVFSSNWTQWWRTRGNLWVCWVHLWFQARIAMLPRLSSWRNQASEIWYHSQSQCGRGEALSTWLDLIVATCRGWVCPCSSFHGSSKDDDITVHHPYVLGLGHVQDEEWYVNQLWCGYMVIGVIDQTSLILRLIIQSLIGLWLWGYHQSWFLIVSGHRSQRVLYYFQCQWGTFANLVLEWECFLLDQFVYVDQTHDATVFETWSPPWICIPYCINALNIIGQLTFQERN